MEDREKNLEELIRNMAEDTGIPASIHPDAVEKRLEAKKKEKHLKNRRKYIAAAAAACLCIVMGIGGSYLYYSHEGAQVPDMTSGTASEVSKSVIASARNYDEIYEYIQTERKQSGIQSSSSDGAIEDAATTESTADGGSASYNGSAGDGYSDTNVREEGVGEADIVKTDGKRLYIAVGQKVEIVGIESTDMEELSEIRLEDDSYVSELYAQDDRLIVLYTRTEYNDGETGDDGFYSDYTCADVYDISDGTNPEKLGTISQSGYYNTMRVRDGYAYVISFFYPNTAAARSDTWAYIPEVQGAALEAADIYMPQRQMGSQYTVISAFSLEDPSDKTDSKAVFGSGGLCYVSTENIYITENYYGADDVGVTQTAIRKVAYADGTLKGAGQTKVNGTLNDSFSIDEYKGNLRLVTTVTPVSGNDDGLLSGVFVDSAQTSAENSNSLYVLDKNLEVTGEIHDLAKDERVYSARFMGDTGYFVTFRQVDPLFSVDLSDPSDPKIIGELKIPGFSEYLHPYGDGLLLGIGMDVDEEGVTTDGVKLSMFDVSDSSDVKETQNYVLEGMYGTDAGYDYRAVFADVEKNLFGFMAYGDPNEYFVFTYGEDGFKEVFSRELNGYGENTRGLYAGDRFYLVSGYTVESYTLDGFEKVDDIVL